MAAGCPGFVSNPIIGVGPAIPAGCPNFPDNGCLGFVPNPDLVGIGVGHTFQATLHFADLTG
jgi:hypothetical protein